MAHKNKIATIFGGTGFVGQQIVRELAARGVLVKVATRIPESAYFLKTCGDVGQVVPVLCDYSDSHSVLEVVKGSDYVVNCIGVLYEKGKKSKFQHAHVDIPALIAKSCDTAGVKRFVHISALGCNISLSKYGKSKLAGERAVLSNFSKATILRPGVIFGEDDNFFNMFAELSRYLPFLPLIGGGKTKMQPVYIGDVADVIIKSLIANNSKSYQGNTYQIGGPDVVTFKEIYEKIYECTGRKRMLVKVPFAVAKFEAIFLSLLPKPLLTRDQVDSLKTDIIVGDGALGFEQFDITPKSMDLIVPICLERYKSGGRFAKASCA